MGLIYSNIPELEGTDTETVLSNLRNLEKELGETFEKRIAHLCELAIAILKDGGDPDIIKSIILSIRSDGAPDFLSVADENVKEMKKFFSDVSVLERLIIFKQVFEEKSVDYLSTSEFTNQVVQSIDRVAYIRNSYNDWVFSHFSALFDGAKAVYRSTLADVCESVLSGDAKFCILPVETGKDGRLMSFYDAIIQNDLKINAECDLKGNDGESFTRYALLSPNVVTLTQTRKSKGVSVYLEMIYSDTDNLPVRSLISAAEYCGLSVHCLDTLSNNSKGERFIKIIFDASGADVKTFLAYLAIDCPDHTIIGYYQRF